MAMPRYTAKQLSKGTKGTEACKLTSGGTGSVTRTAGVGLLPQLYPECLGCLHGIWLLPLLVNDVTA